MFFKSLKSSYANGKIVAFKIDGSTPKITGTNRNLVSLTDNGVGDYSLTFSTALNEPPFVAIFPVTEDVIITQQTDPTTSVVRFNSRSIEKTASLSLNGIKFHSLLSGADGNDISIVITGGATAGAEVISSTSAGAITIQVQTTVSTATQVYAALKAKTDGTLSAFVSYELITGATTWATADAANLTGGVSVANIDSSFDVMMIIDQVGE